MSKPFVDPVAPMGMDVIFTYTCPHCDGKNYLVSPLKPDLIRCNGCRQPFPIIPVDERTIHYLYLMLNNGCAAVDPDFV